MPGPRASLTPACDSCLKEVGSCEHLERLASGSIWRLVRL